jgi:hypothetical protein
MPCGTCGGPNTPPNLETFNSDIEIHSVIIEEFKLSIISKLRGKVNENDFELNGKYFVSKSVEFIKFIGRLYIKSPTSYIGTLYFSKKNNKDLKDFSIFNGIKMKQKGE